MRPSLSLQDDDYRLSFLYGNFTTLTRFTEADLERVVSERLGPLYVSIHATDPELRARLLRNRRGATSLRWLAALLDAGIAVHGQIVVCPGVNDGAALDDTLLGDPRPLPAPRDRRCRPGRDQCALERARAARAHAGRCRARARHRRALAGSVPRRGRSAPRLRRRRAVPARRSPVPGRRGVRRLRAARERRGDGDDVRTRGRRRARRCTGAGHGHPIGLLRLGRRRARVGLPGAARRGRERDGSRCDDRSTLRPPSRNRSRSSRASTAPGCSRRSCRASSAPRRCRCARSRSPTTSSAATSPSPGC